MNKEQRFSKLFRDKKNRLIYYVPNTMRAYVIKNEDEQKINLFHNRLVLSIAFSTIVYSLSNNSFILSLIAVIILYGLMTYFFRNRILPDYTIIEKYDISSNLPKQKENNSTKTLIVSVGYIIVSILLLITLIYFENDQLSKAVILFFSLFGLGTGILELVRWLQNRRISK